MRFLKVLLGVLLVPFAACAQVQLGSLQDLLQYADDHGITTKQARLQPMVAQQDIGLAASGLYPRVNAFATGDYYPIIATQIIPAEFLGGTPGTYLKAQFGLPYIFQAGVEAGMPVIDLAKWAQLSRSRAQYHQAEWGSRAAIEEYHIQLEEAYYQSLVTGEVLKLNKENEQTAAGLMEIMDARHKAGILNPADYNRSRILQLDVQSLGITYQKALQQNINNLHSLLTTGDSLYLTEDISSFTWPSLQDTTSINNRAAWSEAAMKVQVAELSLAESRTGPLPKLALAGRYAYNRQQQTLDFGNHVEFNVANVNMRLDVPLFQGNYYRSLQKKNKFQLDAAKYEQQRTEATLTRQQADWFAQYQAAYDRNSVLKQKVDDATDNLRIARLDLKEGLMEFDEFNDIFNEYNRTRITYLQNLADGILYYLLSTQNF